METGKSGKESKKIVSDRVLETGKDVLISLASSFGGQMAGYFFFAGVIGISITYVRLKYRKQVEEYKNKMKVAVEKNVGVVVDKYNNVKGAIVDKILEGTSRIETNPKIDDARDKLKDTKVNAERVAEAVVAHPGVQKVKEKITKIRDKVTESNAASSGRDMRGGSHKAVEDAKVRIKEKTEVLAEKAKKAKERLQSITGVLRPNSSRPGSESAETGTDS